MADLSSLLLHGPLDAATLMRRLGISQATLSRLVTADTAVLKFGRARATRYALLHPQRGEHRFPLWQIDRQGRAHQAGELYPTWPAGSMVLIDAHNHGRFYDGLPWMMNDMRPQGFLGRAWGKACAFPLGLPEDIRLWHDEHLLIALTTYGNDIAGNWLPGAASYQRWLQYRLPEPITQQNKHECYPAMAEKVLSGEEAGSSAGGEQPKFTCFAELSDGEFAHVLVKFTPARSNENSQRWADLLRAEALALQMLEENGVPAARATVFETRSGQVFLEIVRFDRINERGRQGIVSLESVQAEFTGGHQRWPEALNALVQQKKIAPDDAQRGTLQWAFGRLIANGDMHAGNLSFFLTSPLSLTPAYDMLPMSFAPGSAGQMRDVPPVIEPEADISQESWLAALTMAQTYWQRIADDAAWSDGFRQIARGMQQTLNALAPQIARMA